MLRTRALCKTYMIGVEKLDVLRNVTLSIPRGQVTTIQGASGAGKSTLLHLLGALDTPTSGEVLLKERSIAGKSPLELATLRNRRFGFIFQAYQLLPELDALENVLLPASISRTVNIERGRQLLHDVGLKSRLNHKPGELSGGEQQRVAIARALINDPDIVFADEPTGNLDSHTGAQIAETLLSLVRQMGKTLVLVTHESSLAARGDQLLKMKDGEIVA